MCLRGHCRCKVLEQTVGTGFGVCICWIRGFGAQSFSTAVGDKAGVWPHMQGGWWLRKMRKLINYQQKGRGQRRFEECRGMCEVISGSVKEGM